MGLAISKRIIEMHGGRIWIDSVVGQGSTFSLTQYEVAETLTSSGERLVFWRT